MTAEAEGDVSLRIAVEVEAVGIRKAALVAVRRADQRCDDRARGEGG